MYGIRMHGALHTQKGLAFLPRALFPCSVTTCFHVLRTRLNDFGLARRKEELRAIVMVCIITPSSVNQLALLPPARIRGKEGGETASHTRFFVAGPGEASSHAGGSLRDRRAVRPRQRVAGGELEAQGRARSDALDDPYRDAASLSPQAQGIRG